MRCVKIGPDFLEGFFDRERWRGIRAIASFRKNFAVPCRRIERWFIRRELAMEYFERFEFLVMSPRADLFFDGHQFPSLGSMINRV
jgi:hypothetical protein